CFHGLMLENLDFEHDLAIVRAGTHFWVIVAERAGRQCSSWLASDPDLV
ncbi:hypothetical protein A2U01_0109797, partial [Trifolium medium]|nr:hypothetical protein [Trifolium medium]